MTFIFKDDIHFLKEYFQVVVLDVQTDLLSILVPVCHFFRSVSAVDHHSYKTSAEPATAFC